METNYVVNRIGYVYVPTSDIDASIAWYTRNLSMKLVNKFEDRGSYLGILHQAHEHAIALVLVETEDRDRLEIARNGRPFPILALQCSDIERTYATLKDKGVDVDSLETLGTGEAKYFYFRDDQGNMLEMTWTIWDPEDTFKEDFEPSS